MAVKILLSKLYAEGTPLERMLRRNEEIRRLLSEGVSKTEIGRCFGISARRVGQILKDAGV